MASASILLAATGCCGIGYDAHCLHPSSSEIALAEEEEELLLAPVPRFHPAPTRPVFSPAVYAETPLLETPLLETPPVAAPETEQIGPLAPEGIPAVEQIGPGVPNGDPLRMLPPPDAKLLAPPVELLAPPPEYQQHEQQQGHGDLSREKNAPRTAAALETDRKWLRR